MTSGFSLNCLDVFGEKNSASRLIISTRRTYILPFYAFGRRSNACRDGVWNKGKHECRDIIRHDEIMSLAHAPAPTGPRWWSVTVYFVCDAWWWPTWLWLRRHDVGCGNNNKAKLGSVFCVFPAACPGTVGHTTTRAQTARERTPARVRRWKHKYL